MTSLQQRLLLLVCSLAVHAHGLPLLSYGPAAGDSVLPRTNGASSPAVQLSQPFQLYGTNYSTVYVNANGVITFQSLSATVPVAFPNGTASIAPFWTVVDQESPSATGNIFYRVTNESTLALNFTNIVRESFRGSSEEFNATQMLIVTWERVKGVDTEKTNTFQCILASNDVHSYVFFVYADDMMRWPGSPYALVGLNAGDGVHHLTIPTSQSEAVLNIATTSNTEGNNNIWVFRTDDNDIIQPGAIVGLDQSSYEVGESDGSLPVCVILYDGVLAEDVEVSVSSRRGGTGEPGDFIAASHQVTFDHSPGDSTRHKQCLSFNIVGDDILEDDETYEIQLTLQSSDAPVTILPHTTLVTIIDDDTVAIAPKSTPQTVVEGRSSNQICFDVIGRREIDITYFFTLSPDTALEGEDYDATGANVDLRVPRGSSNPCFPVSIINDNIFKTGRRFYYSLGSHDPHVTIQGTRGIIEITDNDEEAVTIGFEHSEYYVMESESIDVCMWITTAGVGQPFSVTVFTGQTSSISLRVVAEVNVDFVGVRQNLTFLPNETLRTKKCITIQTNDDNIYEGVEQYGLHMRLDYRFAQENSPARLYIRENDEIEVTISDSVYTVYEGRYVSICAEHTGNIETFLPFDLAVTPGTATVSGELSDINPLTIESFYFTSFSRRECPRIYILTDSTFEEEYETFTVTLVPTAVDPDPDHVHLVNASTLVRIRDGDVVKIKFLDRTRTVYENQHQTRVNPCVNIRGHSSVDIPVSLSYSGGNATNDYDYDLVGGDISFNANRNTMDATDCQGLTVHIHDDPVVEATEQVDIQLVSPQPRRIQVDSFFASQPVTSIVIEDDDFVYVSFVAQLLNVSEGAGGIDVCLKMRGFTEINLSASIATAQDSAIAGTDFQPQSVQLTFPPTNQSIIDDLYQLPVAEQFTEPLPESSPQCSHVAIIDDDILEEVDSKLLRLSLTMGGHHVRFEAPNSVLVTIIDDDAVTLEVAESEVSVNEGDRVARVCARMIGLADFAISAIFTTTDDSAESPDDYDHSQREIVFPADSSTPQCAEFSLVDDNVVEFMEKFNVTLSVGTRHARVRIGESDTVVVTIDDNDFANIGFEQADFSTVERAGQVSVCAQLDGMLSRPVSVSLYTRTGPGTATAGVDYTPVANVPLFASLETQRDCVDITILDDSVLEDTESFEVALVSTDDKVHFSRRTANVYLLDDDGVRMGLMERDYAGYEGDEVEICVKLVGMISQNIQVDIRTVPESARAGADYESFSESFTFQPLTINEQKVCHNLTLLDDSLLEDQESLAVTMDVSHPGVSIHISQATVVIMDDDEVTLSLQSSMSVVSEDVGRVEVCVNLQGSTEKTIEYSVVASPGTAQASEDYRFVPSSGSLAFPPSTSPSQQQCYNIDILDDVTYEATEQFSLELSANVSRVNLITSLIRVDIRDNDAVTVGLNQTEFAVVEELQSGGVSFTVCTELTGTIEKTIVVRLFSEPSSLNVNEQDYTAVDELLTFEPSDAAEQSICHPVVVKDDRAVEGAEFFLLRLTSSDPVVVLEPDSATVTITDGDVVCVSETLDTSRGFLEWPESYPSETIKIPCKEGGVAIRLCSITGQWEEPDLSNCRVSAAKLFKYLMMHPFSEENFAELLYAVQLLNENSGDPDLFKTEYMYVVHSYFEQFFVKVINENKTITPELLEITLSIIDGVQEWPGKIIEMYSSRFVSYAERLIGAYVAATNTTSFERGLKHSSFFLEKSDPKTVLSNDKAKTVQYAKDGTSGNYVRVPESLTVGSIKSSITLPPSLGALFANESGNVGVVFSMYETGIMFPIAEGNGARRNETNVSSVISATVLGQAVRNLKDNITYVIHFGEAAQNVSGVLCVSWDFNAANGRGNWTSKGCTNHTDGSGGNVTCSCNHLTNFAVLVDVRPKVVRGPLAEKREYTLSVISITGVAVSILGLLLTIITLLAFKKLRQRDSTVLRIQFCVSVILMLLSFVAGVRQVQLFEVCVTISALIHYFTLVSLMWMAAEALLLFMKAIISTNVNYRYFIIVSLICWLLPIPAVVIPIGLDRNFVTHDEYCFISHGIVFYAAFLGPIAAILIFNLLIFLIVVCVVIRHSSQRYKDTQKHSKRKGIMLSMLNIIAVLVLFGLTWLFGAFTVQRSILPFGNSELFEFLFVVCNSLQGFYVFIFFVVLAKETRQLWLETCGCRKKKEELLEAHMESIPGTPSVSRVPSLRRPTKPFNIDEYGRRLEELTVDTPDTRKRMNSWDIMYVMPQNQFHILFSGDHQFQQHPAEQKQEEDIEKEVDILQDGGEVGGVLGANEADQDNKSTADSGIMDDKAKSTPSPTMGKSHDLNLAHPQPGGTPHHVHSVSGIGYISDEESAEDGAGGNLPGTFKQTKSHDQSRDIELGGRSTSRHSLDALETSKV